MIFVTLVIDTIEGIERTVMGIAPAHANESTSVVVTWQALQFTVFVKPENVRAIRNEAAPHRPRFGSFRRQRYLRHLQPFWIAGL